MKASALLHILQSRYSLPLKMSGGRYERRSPQRGHVALIQVSGIVITGAGMLSPHPLHATV